ncbi:MAG: TlpA family protein disulfide reductase [Prevotella sp.]
MRRLAIIGALLLSAATVFAAGEDRMADFMRKYSSNFAGNGVAMQNAESYLGKPMPAFDFGKGLDSKSLKGKTVVLTYWATWCGGCRLLCQDLDSVMFRGKDTYPGVQVIGVDADERLVDKGYKAGKYWKEKGIHYPTTAPGKAADQCAKSISAGHPTTVIIDKQGIIRGRWDAWSPGVAGDVALAAWVLELKDKEGVSADVPTVRRMLKEGHADRALYLLEEMPTDTVTDGLRLQALTNYKQRLATSFFNEFKEKYSRQRILTGNIAVPNNTAAYIEAMKNFRDAVLALPEASEGILKCGCTAASIVVTKEGSEADNYLALGLMYRRYAEVMQQWGNGYIGQAMSVAKQNGADPAVMANIKQTMNKLGISENNGLFDNAAHRQMVADEKEQAEHIATLNKK